MSEDSPPTYDYTVDGGPSSIWFKRQRQRHFGHGLKEGRDRSPRRRDVNLKQGREKISLDFVFVGSSNSPWTRSQSIYILTNISFQYNKIPIARRTLLGCGLFWGNISKHFGNRRRDVLVRFLREVVEKATPFFSFRVVFVRTELVSVRTAIGIGHNMYLCMYILRYIITMWRQQSGRVIDVIPPKNWTIMGFSGILIRKLILI